MENTNKTNKQGVMERQALSRVPADKRQSWQSIAFIWIGSMICIPMLMVGGILSSMMTLGNIAIAAALGFAICSLIMVAGGMQATDLGLPASMLATKTFGDKGASFITSVIVFIANTGWFGVQTAACAAAFNVIAGFLGFSIPFWISSIVWGTIMLISAVFGFKFIKVLNYITVPALLLVCVIGVVNAINTVGWADIAGFTPEMSMPMPAAVSLVIGLFAVGTVINADFTRYSKKRSDTFLATVIGVLPMAVIMIVIGAILALGAGSYDISVVFANMGVPALGLVILVIATWTTNVTNAYTAGLAAMKILSLKDAKRPIVTAVCGVLGIGLAISGLTDALMRFIEILASLVPPVSGVIAADYWIVCKGKPENWHPIKGFNWCGIIAWVCGGVVALFFSFFSPALDGIIVCLVAYLILNAVAGKTALGGRGKLDIDELEAGLK